MKTTTKQTKANKTTKEKKKTTTKNTKTETKKTLAPQTFANRPEKRRKITRQCRSKGNISGGARERRRREPLGGSGGMLPQKSLKSRGLEMLFPAVSRSYLRFTHIANYLLRTLSQQTNAL